MKRRGCRSVIGMAAWIPPEQWYASVPTVLVSTGALIADPDGRVLVVKPNYRPTWTFPGGVLEEAEPPHEGCAREVREETGLELDPGPLLVTAWAAPAGDRPRAAMYLVFDGGTIPADTPIALQEDELDDYAFLPPDDAADRMAPVVADRLRAAVHARRAGHVYLPAHPAD